MLAECSHFEGVYHRNGVPPEFMRMEYHHHEAIVDLEPFFDQLFGGRDDYFGSPEFGRKEPKPFGCQYNFTLEDVIQTFLGRYSLFEFCGFINNHISPDDPKSDSFLMQLERSFQEYRLAHLRRHHEVTFLIAQGFEGKEINQHLTTGLKRRKNHLCHGVTLENLDELYPVPTVRSRLIRETRNFGEKNRHKYFNQLQKALLGANLPILVCPHPFGPGLDYLSLIRAFPEIDTDGLEIIKSKATTSYDS